MAIKILTCDSEKISAKKLADSLGVTLGLCQCDTGNNDTDVFVRWGSSRFCGCKAKEYPKVINSSVAILNAVDKELALKLLSTKVKIPTLYWGNTTIPAGVRVVYRERYHSEGSNFKVITGPFRVEGPGYHATEFIPTPYEYRAWVCGDRVRVAKRIKLRENEDYEVNPCRSKWGYEVITTTDNMKKLALASVKVLKLDFGAVDFLWSEDHNCYFVLEVNTGPSLDTPALLEFFRAGVLALAESKYPAR